MLIKIPAFSLVVLIGPSSSGKSHFAAKHFLPTEIVSSDACRAMVCDDENDMDATDDAFALLHTIVATRLSRRKLTVVDATNVQPEARRSLLALAREYHCLPVAVVFKLPEKVCQARSEAREDREFGKHVIRNQIRALRRSLKTLKKEGFRHLTHFASVEDVESASIKRQPLWTDKRSDEGPFDIIGDIHGCLDECLSLLALLGYEVEGSESEGFRVSHPEERRALFLGDLVDRGPRSPGVLRLVMDMVDAGMARCVPGNHDMKLLKWLRGKKVRLTHGLAETVAQLEPCSASFKRRVEAFLDGLVSHFILDHGKLVVAHAGLREEYQGRASGRVRDFALYGETTGETDEFGLPVRYQWASEYRGKALVVYGHTPVPEVEWLNHTVCLDTGCVFGGKLTALRYPERELVQVEAARVYAEPIRPLQPVETAESAVPERTAQQMHDDLLWMEDVSGKRYVSTRLRGQLSIREENAAAALEVMARFAVDPRWLVYLPPTMSPPATSTRDGLLEHPDEAFAYFQNVGVQEVICEQKHMGSRMVMMVMREPSVAVSRFGLPETSWGVCYTRTGRPFFSDASTEQSLLERVSQALEQAGTWDELETNWVCLDTECMPWSAKAQVLLEQQYAPVGTAGELFCEEALARLNQAVARGGELSELGTSVSRFQSRAESLAKYQQVYGHYCWPVASLEDLTVAPFHILASEGAVHHEKPHLWHMETIASFCYEEQDLLMATPFMSVDLLTRESCEKAIAWWWELTSSGGEGMVVKPASFLAYGSSGILQPAIKCRGPEYLRLIYGPEYLLPEHLERLRARGLSRKRSCALREFALGVEGLQRFVERRPLREIHECVFGVLALESEGVDPRL
jgi:protein phosphatase